MEGPFPKKFPLFLGWNPHSRGAWRIQVVFHRQLFLRQQSQQEAADPQCGKEKGRERETEVDCVLFLHFQVIQAEVLKFAELPFFINRHTRGCFLFLWVLFFVEGTVLGRLAFGVAEWVHVSFVVVFCHWARGCRQCHTHQLRGAGNAHWVEFR